MKMSISHSRKAARNRRKDSRSIFFELDQRAHIFLVIALWLRGQASGHTHAEWRGKLISSLSRPSEFKLLFSGYFSRVACP